MNGNQADLNGEKKMKAQQLFNLTIYSNENGIALVGDGQERFEVRSECLDQEIESNDITSAYDQWCLNSQV